MKKKVCILQNGLTLGGTDTFVVNLCRGIDKERFEVTVVNPCNTHETTLRESELLATGAKIIHTRPLSGIKNCLIHLYLLFRLLEDGKFDVFQTNVDLFNGPQLLVAWLAGVPIRCCHSHNTKQQKSVIKGQTLFIRIYQVIMRWMCWTFSNRRCGDSKDAMNFLFKGRNWQQERFSGIIYIGIDISSFRKPINISCKRKELGLTSKYHIITEGRIVAQKNPMFIAESFAYLCKKRDDVDLVWIGTGPYENECREILQKEGIQSRVHFLGSRADANEILPCCDMFYFPSLFEGLGIVLIEAQAAGLPCIVSDMIPQEADCGGLIKLSLNNDMEMWVNAINDVIDKKIELKIKETSLNRFNINNMAAQMMQVFEF